MDMALAAGATSLALMLFAIGGAVPSDQPLARRLGWIPSGLPPAVLVALVLGMLATSQIVEEAIALAGFEDVGNLAEFRRVVAGTPNAQLLPSLVGLALLPGLGEELALRGWIQRGLEPRWGARAAVVTSAALFGLLHGEVVHAVGAFFLGLYLGAVVALSGSLRPAVLCHVVNNLVATLGAAWGVSAAGFVLLVSGVVAGPWAMRQLWLRRRPAPAPLGENPQVPAPDDPRPPTP